jgi:cytidyltransferase-like protein
MFGGMRAVPGSEGTCPSRGTVVEIQGGSKLMARRVGYAPGAYDLFHVGHLNLLRQAREHCDYLVAGVVADDVLEVTKGRLPIIPLAERMEIVRHISLVD